MTPLHGLATILGPILAIVIMVSSGAFTGGVGFRGKEGWLIRWIRLFLEWREGGCGRKVGP